MMIDGGHYNTQRINLTEQFTVIRKPTGIILLCKFLRYFGVNIDHTNELALGKRSIYAGMVLAQMAYTNHTYTDLLHEKLTSCLSLRMYLGDSVGNMQTLTPAESAGNMSGYAIT
jgi:hypothetical protein